MKDDRNTAKHMPALQVDIFLVPYGYQIDFMDFRYCRPDGTSGLIVRSICRDFSTSYEMSILREVIKEMIIEGMEKLERTRLRGHEKHE